MFGQYFTHPTSGRPTGLVAFPPRGSVQELGLLTSSPNQFVVLRQRGGDSLAVSRVFPLTGQYHMPVLLHATPPGMLEMAALTPDGDAVAIIRASKSGMREQLKTIEGYADRILFADVDGDGQREILAFGRRMAGIAVLRRDNAGSYVWGATLLPEVTAGDVSIADANGDGVNDVLLLDWLNNRVSIFFSNGGGFLSDPSEFRLAAEPGSLAVARTTEQLLMAVTLPQRQEVLVLSCDLSGRLGFAASVPLRWESEAVAMRDVNGDGRADIVSLGGDAVSVVLAEAGGKFASPITYHGPAHGSPWLLEDLDGDAKADLVFADSEHHEVCVVQHSVPRTTSKGILRYLVGKNPAGIVIDDINGDGFNDIVAANSGSATLSVLAGRGARGFQGQRIVNLPEDPGLVASVAAVRGSPHRFVVAHPALEEFTVLGITADISAQFSVSFPAGLDARILSASTEPRTGWTTFLGRYRNREHHGYSVSLFEQIGDRVFVERGLSERLPPRVVAAAASQSSDSARSLFVVSYERRDRLSRVIAISLDEGRPRGGERVVATLPDSLGRIRWIVAHDLDRDGVNDLLFGTDHLSSQLGIFYGLPDSDEVGPAVWVQSPSPSDDQWVVVYDIDQDGRDDLVLPEADRQTLSIVYGEGFREFSKPESLCPTPDMTAFAVGPLLGTCDIAFTSAKRGTVSIVVEPFRRRR